MIDEINGDIIFVVNNIFNHTPVIKQYVNADDIDDLKQDVYVDILENMTINKSYTIYNMTELIMSSILSRIDDYVQYHKINMLLPGLEIMIQQKRNDMDKEFISFGE